MHATPRVGFYANNYSASTASIRLRCIRIIDGLKKLGIEAERYQPARSSYYDVVIFSKTYDGEALAACRAHQLNGGRAILDLCDNHFYGEEDNPRIAERAARLSLMIDQVNHLTVSTDTLAKQIRNRFGIDPAKISVTPDPIDTIQAPAPSLKERIALFRLKRFLRASPEALRLVWFGNHGAGHAASGLSDLARIAPILNSAARENEMSLTVISNSRTKFLEIARGLELRTHYLSWGEGSISSALSMQHVAIIPISPNPFTEAKSINRPATAIMAGLGVVADAIPSYEELRPYIKLEDWRSGLTAYAVDRDAIHSTAEAARGHLLARYDIAPVALEWRNALLKA